MAVTLVSIAIKIRQVKTEMDRVVFSLSTPGPLCANATRVEINRVSRLNPPIKIKCRACGTALIQIAGRK